MQRANRRVLGPHRDLMEVEKLAGPSGRPRMPGRVSGFGSGTRNPGPTCLPAAYRRGFVGAASYAGAPALPVEVG